MNSLKHTAYNTEDITAVNIYIYIYIQGDSGGICETSGNDSMCDSKQKVHMNMGPILNGYGVMTA